MKASGCVAGGNAASAPLSQLLFAAGGGGSADTRVSHTGPTWSSSPCRTRLWTPHPPLQPQKLGFEYIDLFLLHSPGAAATRAETWAVLERYADLVREWRAMRVLHGWPWHAHLSLCVGRLLWEGGEHCCPRRWPPYRDPGAALAPVMTAGGRTHLHPPAHPHPGLV